MNKRKIGALVLSLIAIVCLSIGIVGCSKSGGSTSGKNPRIVIRTDDVKIVTEVGTSYTTPIAGVFDENLDRIDGFEIITSLYSPRSKDTPIEESTDKITVMFTTRGVYRVVYTAYKNGDVDTSVQQAEITINVCSKLVTPSNFKVDGKTLTWDKVANASGYGVSVNGGEEQIVSTESFTSDIFNEKGYYVAVVAKGDNEEYIDSKLGSYQNRTPLKDGELMAFNDPNYELDIEPGTEPDITLPPDEIEWLSEEECEGSTGGAVKLRIRSGNYGWGVFSVLIMDGVTIDTNKNWAGMEVRFKIDTENYTENTHFLLNSHNNLNNDYSRGILVKKDNNNQWLTMRIPKEIAIAEGYKKYSVLESSSYEYNEETGLVTWDRYDSAYGYRVIVKKYTPNEDGEGTTETSKTYKEFSIDNGYVVDENKTEYSFDVKGCDIYDAENSNCTYSVKVECEIPASYTNLHFNIYNMARTIGKGYVYLDYVRLYGYEEDGTTVKQFLTPQNLRYENGKILWDKVDGCLNYTLNIIKAVEDGKDSTYYTIDGNKTELDLSSIGIDVTKDRFTVEIMATPIDATYCSSEWNEFRVIDAPKNLRIEQSILKWDSVENAVGYIVNIGGKEIQTNAPSLDISSYIALGDVSAKVMAMAELGYIDSAYSKPVAKITVSGEKLATFSNSAYEMIVSLLTENNVPLWNANNWIDYSKVSPKRQYVSKLDGTTDGALYIQPIFATYQESSARHAVFTVKLPNALDISGTYDGVKIRFKVDGVGNQLLGGNEPSVGKLYMQLVNATEISNGYKTYPVNPYVEISVGEWQEWTISNEQLATLCENGDTEIAFAVVNTAGNAMEVAVPVNMYLDDMSYYTTLPTPENVVINGNQVTWNAVDGAEKYVVNVNGIDETIVTTTSYDISSYQESVTIMIKASADGKVDSYYSQKVSKLKVSGNDIANFDSIAYESIIKLADENNVKPWMNQDCHIDYSTLAMAREYVSDVEGSNGGALYIQPVIAHYGSGGGARHALFTINLPNALILDGNADGIVIRFKVLGLSKDKNGNPPASGSFYINLVNPTTKSLGYTKYGESNTDPFVAVTQGEWIEWKISNADLKKLYNGGEQELSFVIVHTAGGGVEQGFRVDTYLDYIKYYND